MTKSITYICVSMLWLLSAVAPAAARSYKGGITVVPLRFERQSDSLCLDLEIDLSGVKVRSAMSIDLEPRLVSDEWSSGMPVISIKGRRNYDAFVRSRALNGATSDGNVVLKGYGRRTATVRYVQAVRYEPYMNGARLELISSESGCGGSRPLAVLRLADSLAVRSPLASELPVRPLPVFAEPQAEQVKSREIETECMLDFVVNRTNISPAYMNNPAELAKIRAVIDELHADPSIGIVGIEIVGYASPEGSLAGNKRLSEGRAVALRDYLASQYDFPGGTFRMTFGGENWDGLVRALENSDMEYRQQILDIIRDVPVTGGRESRIVALNGGEPYRYLLRNVFPSLRTAVCKISYRIRGFDAREALEVFLNRPQNLSLNEFYMVANTMGQDSPEFAEVFETAVRMYPDDETANLNAAVAALRREDTASAKRYLDRLDMPRRNRAEYFNALGTMAWLNGESDAAAVYFREAELLGLEAAAENLKAINDPTRVGNDGGGQ